MNLDRHGDATLPCERDLGTGAASDRRPGCSGSAKGQGNPRADKDRQGQGDPAPVVKDAGQHIGVAGREQSLADLLEAVKDDQRNRGAEPDWPAWGRTLTVTDGPTE